MATKLDDFNLKKKYLSAIVPVARAVRKAETRVPETSISCHISDRDKSLFQSINKSINQSIYISNQSINQSSISYSTNQSIIIQLIANFEIWMQKQKKFCDFSYNNIWWGLLPPYKHKCSRDNTSIISK